MPTFWIRARMPPGSARLSVAGHRRRAYRDCVVRRLPLRLAVPLLASFFGLVPGAHAVVTVPDGFVDEEAARVQQPTAIAFTPAKKMFVTERTGKLWASRSDGSSNKVLALDLTSVICTNGERGLLGLTFDPDFNTNRYLYLYYTRARGSTAARATRAAR